MSKFVALQIPLLRIFFFAFLPFISTLPPLRDQPTVNCGIQLVTNQGTGFWQPGREGGRFKPGIGALLLGAQYATGYIAANTSHLLSLYSCCVEPHFLFYEKTSLLNWATTPPILHHHISLTKPWHLLSWGFTAPFWATTTSSSSVNLLYWTTIPPLLIHHSSFIEQPHLPLQVMTSPSLSYHTYLYEPWHRFTEPLYLLYLTNVPSLRSYDASFIEQPYFLY